MTRRTGLGRGLAALIPPGEDVKASLIEVDISEITPNPHQPREVFDDAELEGLAASIKDMGLLQPVVVRLREDQGYDLIAGERRVRAAKLAGLERLPAIVRHTEDADLLKEALVENIHRVQLNPLEEAAAYRQLLDDFGFTQEELANSLGRSRPSITNTMRLLSLPAPIQRRVAAGVLSAGHARAVLGLPDASSQEAVAERIVSEGLSVRATEELVRLKVLDDPDTEVRRRRSNRPPVPGGMVELQDDLTQALRTRVRISMGAKRGRMQIEFGSVEDLERIVDVIARGLEDGTVSAEIVDR